MLSRRIATNVVIGTSLALLTVPAWAWGSNNNPKGKDTHRGFTGQAVVILQNDADSRDVELREELDRLVKFQEEFLAGSIAPDFDQKAYALYQDHFFDPDSGRNFTYHPQYPLERIEDTAESRTRYHLGVALAKWRGQKFQEAAFSLGIAMHYFADLCEPHHAANQTGGPGTAHTWFETWLDGTYSKYLVQSTGASTADDFYQDGRRTFNYVTDEVGFLARTYGLQAKGMARLAQVNSTWADWERVAANAGGNAQKAMARVLFRFLKETRRQPSMPGAGPIGSFFVELGTGPESDAGTDDYVFFGMEMENGRSVEFPCDVAGNDFTPGSVWGYEFIQNDPTFRPEQIRRVWVRKRRYTVPDAWKLTSFHIYMKGTCVFVANPERWVSGVDEVFSFPVRGFDF